MLPYVNHQGERVMQYVLAYVQPRMKLSVF